jgi:diguanylate cyclase (GGDEF)-like protein
MRDLKNATVWSLRWFVVGLWLVASELLVVVRHLGGPTTPVNARVGALAVTALFVCGEVFVVHVRLRRDAHTFSFGEIATVVGLFVLVPIAAVICAAIGSGLAFTMHRRQRGLKLWFNLAKAIIEIEIAIVVFHALVTVSSRPGLGALCAAGAAAITASVVGAALVTAAIALSERSWHLGMLRDLVGLGSIGTAVAVSIGLVSVVLIWSSAGALGFLVVPAAGCYWLYLSFGRERQRLESLQLLYRSTRLLHESPAIDDAIVALLVETRATLRARVAEIVYRPTHGDTEMHVAVSDEAAPAIETQAVAPAIRKLAAVARQSSRTQVIGADDPHGRHAEVLEACGYSSALIARLVEGDATVGAIIVADHTVDVARFDREDCELVEALAGALSIALENGALERTLAHAKVLEGKLQQLAHHDQLTGLPNRTRFNEHLAELGGSHGQSKRRFAVLYVDLDDFKTVNDSLGHEAGDELLTIVARRLTSCLREGDVVARLGGDEFAILVAAADDPEAPAALAERIHAALIDPVALSTGFTRVSASVGIASSSDADDTKSLLRSADAAMYQAKATGKQRSVVFQSAMHTSMIERHQLLNDLHRAVEEQQITIMLQPIVHFDGGLHGAEVLARWDHPTRGQIPPEIFIPLAEETNLITKITRSVLTAACMIVADGTAAKVSVNISATDIRQPSFAADVESILQATGVQANDIMLEMTETQLMSYSDALEVFLALRRVGVRLALDDFGTGYSSLGVLREYPINQLKIAKPFIDDLETDPAAKEFVGLIVGLGRSLNLEVVAEGIERGAQVDILSAHGCHLGQGFYFARPQTPEQYRTTWSQPSIA